MCSLVGATELSKALIEAGKNLLKPHSSTDGILSLVDEIETLLSYVDQDRTGSVRNALIPSMEPLVSAALLGNPDSDVRVFVVTCLTEIVRITAPDAPYKDDQMKEIFQVTLEAFGKLADPSCRSYRKAEVVLDIVSRVRSFLVMVDLEFDDLVLEMFQQFLKIISPDHPQVVLLAMETIMVTVIDESEQVSTDLLDILLASLKKDSRDVSPIASKLAETVLTRCTCKRKLRLVIMEALKSTGTSLDMYSPVVSSICQSKLGKLAAKKASLPAKVGQTNQSASTGSRKRNQTKMEETSHDAGSLATSTSNKASPDEEDSLGTNVGKLEDIKTAKSSKKERAHNVLGETSAKKPLAETKMLKTSEEKLAHSDAKKKNPEVASKGTPTPQSSKNKKNNSRATTHSTKESEQTPISHPKRKQTESNKNDLGEELVGKRVKVWWPLDKKFYEGVIHSYCILKKEHKVSYIDGQVENLNLKNEKWLINEDNSLASEEMEIDLPESSTLVDFMRRQKAKKSKDVSMNVVQSRSSEVRSSMRTMKKNDSVTNSSKQAKRTKGGLKAVSNEPESRDAKNLRSMKELNAEPGRTEKRQMHQERGKDCDEKEEPESKGEDSLKFGKESIAELECKRDHQELLEDLNAATKTDGEEVHATTEPIGIEHKGAKKPFAVPKNGEEIKVVKEPTADLKTNGEERKSVKETNAEPESEAQERESGKDPTADSEWTEKEDMSEEKREESDTETYASVSETGKVEKEAEEDDRRVVEDFEEESGNAEVERKVGISSMLSIPWPFRRWY